MGDGNEKKRKPTVENGFQVGIKRGGRGGVEKSLNSREDEVD